MFARKSILLWIFIAFQSAAEAALPLLLNTSPLLTEKNFIPADLIYQDDPVVRVSDDPGERTILGMRPRRFVFLALNILFHLYVIPRTIIRLYWYLKKRKQEKQQQ